MNFPVACPRCGSATGEPCRSQFGRYTLTHIPRITAAEATGQTIDGGPPEHLLQRPARSRAEQAPPSLEPEQPRLL